jgi:hypothetical protein
MGEPQGAKNPVASFHASTTYGPLAATEVSDCPWTCTPDGVTSSWGLAASAFEPNEGLDEELLVLVLDGDVGGLQNIWPPCDNSIVLPFREQTGWFVDFEVACAAAACATCGCMARNANGMARVIAIASVATLKASFDLLRFLMSLPPYSQRGVTLIRNT